MKIPKYIQLAGRKYKIRYSDNMANDRACNGYIHPDVCEIVLQKSIKGTPRDEQAMGITFCHELIHGIFLAAGEDELYSNESLVSKMAELLYQIINQLGVDK